MRKLLIKPELYYQTIVGNKTQTRRDHNLKQINEKPDDWELSESFKTGNRFYAQFVHKTAKEKTVRVIPALYNIGETLYLAEPHFIPKSSIYQEVMASDVVYDYDLDRSNTKKQKYFLMLDKNYKKISPMFLKEVHAREYVQIRKIRIERVQEITSFGAKSEGMVKEESDTTYYEYFINTWVGLHGMEGWNKNPWVWVYQYNYLKDQSRRK
jgi:hypothetical protein